jgi:hypothetical protein
LVLAVSTRSRLLSFGTAGLVVVAGAACGAVIGGGTGQLLALVLISVGLTVATGLVFLEVGLSEDREREQAGPTSGESGSVSKAPPDRRRAEREGAKGSRRMRSHLTLERSRGHRRRLK